MARGRILLWVTSPLLLFALNLTRDLRYVSKKYEWVRVETKTLNRSVTNTGVLEANQVSEIKSNVDEIVEKKYVQEGQSVKKGQLLVELSRIQTQLEFEQSKNSYLNAEVEFKKVSRELEIQKKLLKNLAVSRSQVEETAQSKEKSKSALDIAARQLDIVRKKLESTSVRSPLDGVVLKDFTKLGEKIAPGKEIITVGDISKFIVRTKVDELDIQQVHQGQRVRITADAYPGKTMGGIVHKIASQAERETFAKVEVLIDIIDAANVDLKHNLSVRVYILTEDIPDALGIPLKAVLQKKGNIARVVVKKWLNIVQERKVQLGRVAGDEVEVVSGLKSGALVGVEKGSEASQ